MFKKSPWVLSTWVLSTFDSDFLGYAAQKLDDRIGKIHTGLQSRKTEIVEGKKTKGNWHEKKDIGRFDDQSDLE